MEIILKEDIIGLGYKNDIVNVKSGYVRNYLITQGKGVIASPSAKKILTDNGAEIVNEETWGLKKMAYAIQKKSTGFYCLLEFKGEPTIVEKLETGFRRDEKVIRYITVKEDKHMVAWAEKRRAKLGKKEEA